MDAPEEMATSTSVAGSGASQFDLETYIGKYTGHTKVQRLIFIAEKSAALRKDAYVMAIDELKKTWNTALYNEVMAKVGTSLGAEHAKDEKWVETVEKRAQAKLEKLEQELNSYKANLIKESIRMGHNDLGDFHYDCGNLNDALKCYIRTRDYCQTPKHIIMMCLNVIKVSIEMSNFVHVTNHVTKGEQTSDINDTVILAKLKCAAALAHIENSKYKMAARKFLDTSFELSTNYTEVLAPEDIAVYGGLCALATFDRKDLKTKVIDNPQFKNFLELVPNLRELVNDFYCSRYASCLRYLSNMRAELELDIHLHDHVDSLYEQIRCKALVQYFSPFISVDLNKMAAAFNTDLEALEAELAQLIMKDDIQARIDSHKKILVAQHADLRNQTFSKALQVGSDYVRDTKALILRINLMRNNFVGKAPKSSMSPYELGKADA